MQRLQAEDLPVRVMDIAAGYGRYVLDAIAESPVEPQSILLRDYSDLNVEAGARLIAERALGTVAGEGAVPERRGSPGVSAIGADAVMIVMA